jgi:hypothetical protein
MWNYVRRRFSLIEFLVMMAVFAFLAGFLLLAVQKCFTTAVRVKSGVTADSRPLIAQAFK